MTEKYTLESKYWIITETDGLFFTAGLWYCSFLVNLLDLTPKDLSFDSLLMALGVKWFWGPLFFWSVLYCVWLRFVLSSGRLRRLWCLAALWFGLLLPAERICDRLFELTLASTAKHPVCLEAFWLLASFFGVVWICVRHNAAQKRWLNASSTPFKLSKKRHLRYL